MVAVTALLRDPDWEEEEEEEEEVWLRTNTKSIRLIGLHEGNVWPLLSASLAWLTLRVCTMLPATSTSVRNSSEESAVCPVRV
jgi:hypothetical protein